MDERPATAKAPVPRRSRCTCEPVASEMIHPNPLARANVTDDLISGALLKMMGADRSLVAPPRRPGDENGSWLVVAVVPLVAPPAAALFFRIDIGDSFKFDGAIEDAGMKADAKVVVNRQKQKWRNLSMVLF